MVPSGDCATVQTGADVRPSVDVGVMRGRRAVVFGGCGFLGSHIVDVLAALGASVVRFDVTLADDSADGVEDVRGDINDPQAVTAAVDGADHVFAFAGGLGALGSIADPFADLRSSVHAQLVLLEAVRRQAPGATVVHAGSRLEYGRPKRLPVAESEPLKGDSPYAIHKATCAEYYRLYHEMHGVHSVVLRLPNPYGNHVIGAFRTRGYGILNLFIDRALADEPITLYGDGSQTRDFIHVSDVAGAAVLASVCPSASGEVFNVGSGTSVSLLDAAAKVVRLCGTGSVRTGEPWPRDAAAVETGDFYFDISKAAAILGWSPAIDLESGIEMVLEEMKGSRD